MKRLIAILCLALASSFAWATDPTIGETPEIKYTSLTAPDLNAQAQNLVTPLYIYEYLRDNTQFALYHGSISGSINTYGGMRGNDVDLASTLIAMLRAQNVPTRYVVGTVKLSANQLMNWLGVQNATLAASLLNDAGIQGVAVNADGTVSFEHTWVEALVPYDNYRGIRLESSGSCAVSAAGCQWIALDPSFKQKQYGSQNIDLHDTINFDYTAYYNAIKNNDQSRLNKNPLEIFEDQTLAWLRTNMPGTTLEDVANPGVIQAEDNGLLPASLPYAVVGTPRRYNSVADHDAQVPAVESKKWRKMLTINFTFYDTKGYGYTVNYADLALVDVATQQLTVSYNTSAAQLEIRLGGLLVAKIPSGALAAVPGLTVNPGTLYDLGISIDGPPATTAGGADSTVTGTYQNMRFGGYYLVSTGGETSNWSQVHRAAQQLLAANQTYKIVFNAAEVDAKGNHCDPTTGYYCTPYVDANNNGWDATDPALSATPAAMDALTGGLLYVAGTQYFTKLREESERINELNHTKTPIEGYVGVVSSADSPEYIAGTAFSILPGGLLIDMKGVRLSGSWRIAQPSTWSSKMFKLMGHIGSSLEHETWQELTGYDAVSTVRGIQMALGAGASLQDVVKNTTQNTLPAFYSALGFSSVPPAGFTYAPFTIFTTQPATWSNTTNNTAFDLMKSDVNNSTPTLRDYYTTYAFTSSGSGVYGWLSCINSQQNELQNLVNIGDHVAQTYQFCGNSTLSLGTPASLLSQLQTYYSNTVIPMFGQTYLGIFDRAQGFVPTDYVYRASPAATNAIGTDLAATVRDTVSMLPAGISSMEFLIPSTQTVGSTYRFSVYILNAYDTGGNLLGSTYAIQNNSRIAGGGYVDGTQVLTPATTTLTLPTHPSFNNAVFTSKNTISQTNNDLVKTPSTIDPVSTVTGNNFHDETDITIKGRGLNVALTRTYNSAPSSTSVDRGLGYGWTHSYLMRLKSNDYGICPNCTSIQNPENGNSKTSSITYTDERGGDHNYLVNESTLAVTPPTGEFDQLVLNQGIATPGAALVASSGHYTVVFRNGTRYEFQNMTSCNLAVAINCTARLLHIDDAAGNMLTFNYDASGRLSTVADNVGAGRTVLTFGYDAITNRLLAVTDLASRVWQYGYDTAGNMISVTNPLPATFNYTYYAGTHNLKDVVLPELRNGLHVTTTFSYYQNSRAFNYKDLLGDTETMDYDLFRRSTRVTDPRGGVRNYEYDANGAMTRLTEPDGGILLFSMNPDGLRYQKYDALGYGTQYSYKSDRSFNTASDTFGEVTREQDALAQNIDRDYGLFDQVSHMLDKRGVNTYKDYYTTTGVGSVIGKLQAVRLGSLTSNGVTYSNVTLAQYSWNPDGTIASKTEYLDPANPAKTRVTNYYWINNGLNLDHMTVSGSGQSVTVSYGYDSLGRKTSETLTRRASPVGGTVSLTTSYAYDALDRIILVTDAVGNQLQTIYDKNGKVYQVIANFKKPDTTYETRTLVTRFYDTTDHMTYEADAYGNLTQYVYDAAGNVTAMRDNKGLTQYQYDAMNRRIAVIDANNYSTQTAFDLAGRPVANINSLGKQTTTSYDALGRPIKITDALGHFTSMAYDPNGNLTCLVDANANAGLQPKNTYGCTLYKQYDELNRPVLEVNAENGQTKYVYDLLGNVLSLTDPMSHTWSFAFDNLGRQTGLTDPNGKFQTYQVDEAGNTWQMTDRLGRIVNYTYDNLNRLARADYLADASWETFGFDYHGDLVSVANSAGVSYAYAYDLMHRMLSKTDNRTAQSMSYVYDPLGNPKQKTTYTGDVINYEYDPTNRLIAEQSHGYLQASYQYDGAGRLLTRTLSSGAQTSYAWDDANRLTQITNSSASGAPVSQTSYTRDNVGNILTKSEGASITSYTYDPMYRLLSATGPVAAWNDVYTYDKNGNRLSLTRNGGAVFYDYDAANRLTQTHSGTSTGPIQYQFAYDFEGNLLTKTNASAQILLSLNWNAKNQPASLTASGKTDSFTYDPNGYRAAKTDSLGNKTYLLEGEHLEAVYSGTQLQAKFMRGSVIDEVINAYQFDSTGKWINTTYHHDPQTSVVGLSGHNGDVYNLTAYAPFGEIEQEAGPVKNFLKYTGREQDQDSGLYQYRARYYDPTIGRFISEDPLGFKAGVNFYAYVDNNPINANDPSGNMGILPRVLSAAASAALERYFAGTAIRSATTAAAGALARNPRLAAGAVAGTIGGASGVSGYYATTPDPTPGGATFAGLVGAGQGVASIYAPGAGTFVQGAAIGGFGDAATQLFGIATDPSKSFNLSEFGAATVSNALVSKFFGFAKPGTSLGEQFGVNTIVWPVTTGATAIGQKLGETPANSSGAYSPSLFAPPFDSSAAGGFLIYPNKSNTNQMRAVYAK